MPINMLCLQNAGLRDYYSLILHICILQNYGGEAQVGSSG